MAVSWLARHVTPFGRFASSLSLLVVFCLVRLLLVALGSPLELAPETVGDSLKKCNSAESNQVYFVLDVC